MENPRTYYAIIPADVRYDKELTANAKLLYGEITALCNEKGYCWANNEYFAELYGTTGATVSRWISSLKKKGYIKTTLIYKDGTKEIKERRIYISTVPIDKNINTPIDENVNTSPQNNQEPIDENVITPIDENVKDNNTVVNNTLNNTVNKSSTMYHSQKNDIDLIIKTWNELGLNQIRSISKSTNRHTMLNARINEYGFDDVLQAIRNISSSSFLRGQNKNNWIITFDWLVKPNNFIKVLEDNYSDKADKGDANGSSRESTQSDYGECEAERLIRLAEERGSKLPESVECDY